MHLWISLNRPTPSHVAAPRETCAPGDMGRSVCGTCLVRVCRQDPDSDVAGRLACNSVLPEPRVVISVRSEFSVGRWRSAFAEMAAIEDAAKRARQEELDPRRCWSDAGTDLVVERDNGQGFCSLIDFHGSNQEPQVSSDVRGLGWPLFAACCCSDGQSQKSCKPAVLADFYP